MVNHLHTMERKHITQMDDIAPALVAFATILISCRMARFKKFKFDRD